MDNFFDMLFGIPIAIAFVMAGISGIAFALKKKKLAEICFFISLVAGCVFGLLVIICGCGALTTIRGAY